MFYKHPRMADGHLNKCKDCTRKDVHEKYMDNIENPEHVEKERARGRDKYRRLGYKDKYQHYHATTKKVAARLKKLISIPPEHVIHHWNYNFLYDVFILTRRYHARIHKQLVFDPQTQCFTFDDKILDTREKHENAIRQILGIPKEEQFIKYNEYEYAENQKTQQSGSIAGEKDRW